MKKTKAWTVGCALLFLQTAAAQKLPALNRQTRFVSFSKQVNAYFDTAVKQSRYYKQWKRMEWYFSTRLDAAGRLPDIQGLKQTALQKAETLRTAAAAKSPDPLATSGAWSFLGPTTVSSTDDGIGRVNRLAFHPTDAATLFAATAGGGLWKTTNGGASWSPLTDGLPNMNTTGIAVHKTSPNILYLLTGDGDASYGAPFRSSFGKLSTGVLKSTDGGTTWNYTGLKWKETDGIRPFCLVMHPSNFNTLMVGTDDGLYRTTNGGSTWTHLLTTATIYDIDFMPNSATMVYAAGRGGAFYRSTDGGASWNNWYDVADARASRTSIAVSPAQPYGVYMLVSNSEDKDDPKQAFNGLYYSHDNGDHWTKKSSLSPNVFSGDGVDLFSSQELYDHALAVNPFDSSLVFTGGVRIFRSLNAGSTISIINNSGSAAYHPDIHELVYSPFGNTLYACTDGGIYKTVNNGVTWTPLNNGLSITQYYRISVSTASTNIVLGGAQDNGSHLRSTASSSLERVVGADGMDNAISLSAPSVMYAGTQSGGFHYSTNSGASFSDVTNAKDLQDNYSIPASAAWITPIDVSTTNPYVIFMGYHPLVKGVKGLSWSFYNIGYTGFNNPRVSGRTFVQVAPGNTNIIYAGDNNYNYDGLEDQKLAWRSSDGGQSWKRIYPGGSDDPKFTALTMNPDDPKEIWVTAGNFEAGKKVYRSLDSGQTWSNISGSLPNVPVNCILYDDNNGSPNDALYIGTDIGVFYRDNTLGDWVPFSTNLPVVEVTDLELNETAGLLRAGTYGRGIWQTSLYAPVCITNQTFTSHVPSEPHFYNVAATIASSAEITGAGAHIQYKAGERITLNKGFRVDATSGPKFIAYIGPCNGSGVPPTYKAPQRPSFNGLPGYLRE